MKYFVVWVALWFAPTLFACEVTDGLGKRVSATTPAKRIISLTPALTENLFSVGAAQQIVGVIKDSDYPEAAKQLPIVGAYNALDKERMLLLKPDLIVTWGHVFDQSLAQFVKLGVPIYATNTQRLEDVAKTLQDLGCLTGHAKTATQVSQHYLRELSQIKKQRKQSSIKTVFYQLTPYSLQTVNHSSWISEAIRYCGGRNIFADLPLAAPEVMLEAVVAANPDIIIVGGHDTRWQQRPKLNAVKQHHLYKINPDLIARPSIRLLAGVRKICSFIEQSHA